MWSFRICVSFTNVSMQIAAYIAKPLEINAELHDLHAVLCYCHITVHKVMRITNMADYTKGPIYRLALRVFIKYVILHW